MPEQVRQTARCLSPPELLELLPQRASDTVRGQCASPCNGPADLPQGQNQVANGRPSPDMQSVSRRVLGARGHPPDPVSVGQCYPVSRADQNNDTKQGERERADLACSSLLANTVTRAGTVPFARERETRQADRCTASDVWMGLTSPANIRSIMSLTS